MCTDPLTPRLDLGLNLVLGCGPSVIELPRATALRLEVRAELNAALLAVVCEVATIIGSVRCVLKIGNANNETA